MGFLSKFEGKMEDTVEGAAEKMSASPLSPVQIAKKAEKQMRREKMVGAGKQYAPTLYTILVSRADDDRLFGYYPTLAGETETYLAAKAAEHGLVMDGQPLVRFIADDDLKHGKFEVIAEMVAAPLIAQLRQEEMERYGLAPQAPQGMRAAAGRRARPARGEYGAGPAANPRAGAANPAPRGVDAFGLPRDDYDSYGDRGGYDNYEPIFDAQGAAHRDMPAAVPGADVPAAGAGAAGAGAAYVAGAGAAGAAAGAAYASANAADAAYAEPRTMVFPQQPAAESAPAPAPAQDLQAYIYDVTNDRAFTLTGRPMGIGRESRNDIVIPDINVSRAHAEIRMEPSGTWVLSDLGSTNGTFVNGRQIKSTPLRDADRIIVGTTELEFQLL